MHIGLRPGALLPEADLVIVLEADVPWIPQRAIAAGRRPLRPQSARTRRSCAIRCAASRATSRSRPARRTRSNALEQALAKHRLQMAEARIAARRNTLTERSATRRSQARQGSGAGRRQDLAGISQPRDRRDVGDDAVIFNEYSLRRSTARARSPARFYALGPAGGLGWGFGAALGAKLAAPDKLVVATLGDGAYMFANPMVGALGVGRAQAADPDDHLQQQPLRRGARAPPCRCSRTASPARTTAASWPTSIRARRSNEIAAAQGGHGERVEQAGRLPAALARARDAVMNGSGRRCST